MITQRVDHSEILINPDQQDAENGRRTDETGAGLGKITEQFIRGCTKQHIRLIGRNRARFHELFASLDDFDWFVRTEQFFLDEDVFFDALDRLVGFIMRWNRSLVHHQEGD